MSSENEDDVPLQKIKTKLLVTKSVIRKDFQNDPLHTNFCCICLKYLLKLYKLNTQSPKHDIKYLAMLGICIPEIQWSSSYYICMCCCRSLDSAYLFWQTCMNNGYLIKQPGIIDKDTKCNSDLNHELLQELGDVQIKEETSEETKDIDIEDMDMIANKTDDFALDMDADLNSNSTNDESLYQYQDADEGSQKKKVKRKSVESSKQVKKRPKRAFTCEECDFRTTISTKLLEHYLEGHKMNPEDVKPFKCDTCSKKFDKFWSMVAHEKSHENDRPTVCTYCGKGFKKKSDLETHEKRHLNLREYECEICGKRYNTYKDLGSHKVAVHTDSSTWKWVCEHCNKPFPIKSNYDSHMRRHTGDKKFACHLCPKRFTDKIVLQNHVRVHSNVKNFKCGECNKEYKTQQVLRIHLATVHSIGLSKVKIPQRSRKYVCHICPKAYFARNHLTRHLYSHSGEKPFGCSVCDKKFICKNYALNHEQKCHAESMVEEIVESRYI